VRKRLTYANVVATLALFLALGGASYAAIRVGSGSIVNNSVRTQDLRNNDVRSRDIRNGAILGRDVGANQLGSDQVKESALGQVGDAAALDGLGADAFARSGDFVQGGSANHTDTTEDLILSLPRVNASISDDGDGDGSPQLHVQNTSSTKTLEVVYDGGVGSVPPGVTNTVPPAGGDRVLNIVLGDASGAGRALALQCGFGSLRVRCLGRLSP
jgi:hypothetical protein